MEQMKISIATLPNGYALQIDDENYMYYTPESLLEGFMIRLGLMRLEEMTSKEISDLLVSLKDGSIAKKLQAEVTELKATIAEQSKQIREKKREIKELKKTFFA